MKIINFDNINSTPINLKIRKFIKQDIKNVYGDANKENFFSTKTRASIELARKNIARIINVNPENLRFTSGITESNNLAFNFINTENTKTIITSIFEHKSVLEPLKAISTKLNIPILFVKFDNQSGIDLEELKKLLKENNNSFVSLSHINRLSGRLLQIKRVAKLCHKYSSVFHCDISLTVGKYDINIEKFDIDIATFSSEKMCGIRGAGFIFYNNNFEPQAIFIGDKNEYNLRPGTENILAIGATAKALKLEIKSLDKNRLHFIKLKKYLFKKLEKSNLSLHFYSSANEHFAPFINLISFKKIKDFDAFFIKLDVNNIMCDKINSDDIDGKPYIQISFGNNTRKKEIRKFLKRCKNILNNK